MIKASEADVEYPTNQSCSAHRREDPQTVRFF